ncbi:MAG: DUF5801 repeats-in-toxin domain-containing protein, partial [Porticoccaceae bacterium]
MNDEVKQAKEIEATEAAQANAQQNGPVTEENTSAVPADAASQGQAGESAAAGDLNPEFEALVQALEAGEDINEQLEATAAGEGGGGAGDSIGTGARLDRIDSQANPNAGIDPDIPPTPLIDPTADTEIIVDTNEAPTAFGGSLRVSEEGLDAGNPDENPLLVDTTNSLTDEIDVPGTDPDGDVLSYALATLETGLESAGVAITFSGDGTVGDPLIGTVPDGDGTQTIITLTVDATGKVTVVLSGPVDHPENPEEDNLSFDVTLTVSDGELSDTATVVVTVEDDSPTASIETVQTIGRDQELVDNTLTLDETVGAKAGDANAADDDIDGGNPDPFGGTYGTPIGAVSDVDLVDTTTTTGADDEGATTVVSLSIASEGVDSELNTTDGTSILLYTEADGTITGRTGGSDGAVIFAISIDNDGLVSVAQYDSLEHPISPDSYDEAVTLTGKVSAVVTVTDGDDDVATDSTDVGDQISFEDDGPSAAAADVTTPTLVLDESDVPDPSEDPVVNDGIDDGIVSASADFTGNFVATDYGTDGAGSVSYTLELTGTDVESGLYTLGVDGAQGDEIVLNESGGVITGSYDGTDYFTISIDNDPDSLTFGEVTFTQITNIYHGDATDADDVETLTVSGDNGLEGEDFVANALVLEQTVTDADGDEASAEVDLGSGVFKIEDDGPSAEAADVATPMLVLDESDVPDPSEDPVVNDGIDD